MRLIDADELKTAFPACDNSKPVLVASVRATINHMPTIEERKKGKWIRHDEIKNIYGGIYIECSECGEKYVVQYIEDEKFCRNCGADMRGEQDEHNH